MTRQLVLIRLILIIAVLTIILCLISFPLERHNFSKSYIEKGRIDCTPDKITALYHGSYLILTLDNKEASELLESFLLQNTRKKEIQVTGASISFKNKRALVTLNLKYMGRKADLHVEIGKGKDDGMVFEVNRLMLGSISLPAKIVLHLFVKNTAYKNWMHIKENEITLHHIGSAGFKLENLCLCEGYMLAVLSLKDSNYKLDLLKNLLRKARLGGTTIE